MNKLAILASLLGVSLAASGRAQPKPELLGETNPLAALSGNQFDGVWWVTPSNGVPGVFVFNRAGSFSTLFATDFGGHNPVGGFSPMKGVWVRRSGRTAEAIGVRFVAREDDKILSAERVRISMSFGETTSSLQGEIRLEEVFCEVVELPPGAPIPDAPRCPDLTTAPTERLREGTFTAKRLGFDAGE